MCVEKKKDQHLETVELSRSDLETIHVPRPSKAQIETTELSRSDLEAIHVPRPTKQDIKAPAPTKELPRPSPRVDVPAMPIVDGRPTVDNPFIKTVIDNRYEVIRCLGTGAMGSVFLAKHLHLDKHFALKMINPEIASEPEFISRFQREAEVSSRLDHPNCISVTDFGRTSDGSFYLIMEFADGTLLSDLIENRPLSTADTLAYIRQVLTGLQHAHGLGLVHRDIKPENLIRCRREDGADVIKILDFGMAKVPLKDSNNIGITREGIVLGTPQYMAPEQIRDDNIDARVDLYAIGVTLLRMLSGRMVFKGDSPLDMFTEKLQKPAPTLAALTKKRQPASLERFIAKALERQPADRFGSAAEMLNALDEVETSLAKPRPTPRAKRESSPLIPLNNALKGAVSGIARGLIGLGVYFIRAGGAIRGMLAAARNDAVEWYACTAFPSGPSLRARLTGLYATHHGRALLVRTIAVSTILVVIITAMIPEAEDASPDTPPPPKPFVAAQSDQTPAAAAVPKQEKDAPEKTETIAPSPAASLPDPAIIEANRLLERKKCKQAGEALDGAAQADAPQVHYLRGRIDMCENRLETALENYQKAVDGNPSYRTDTGILEDAKKMVAHPEVRLPALDFMASALGASALPTLINLAERHPNREVRQHAFELVEKQGAAEHVDRTVALEMDLNQAGACKAKREIVQQLAALNTKKARQVLYRARDAQVKEGFFKKRYKNECIRADINRALSEMRKAEP
jgi:tetratricopeptide (TPR) repeat protein